MTHVVFVCTGNICRSPTAHAVLRQRIAAGGLGDRLTVDSAGLEAWHAGDPPSRTSAAARSAGITWSYSNSSSTIAAFDAKWLKIEGCWMPTASAMSRVAAPW